mgnify:FL=1
MQPALEGGPGEGYGVILGDMAKQREHADAIRAARRELAAAADSMQSALSEDGSSARPVTATP